MEPREARNRRGGLVGAGAVLRRAGAKRVEVRVYTPVLAREVGVVPDHGRLVYLWQPGLLLAQCLLGQHLLQRHPLHVEPGESVTPTALAAFVPDQVIQHSQPPPQRRRALLLSSSPSPQRASPRRRGLTHRRSRSPEAPRWPAQCRASPPRTPRGRVPPGSAARTRPPVAYPRDSVPLRSRAPRPRVAPPVP